ncbi:6-bladed beta-propeller [Paraglaciecola aquimarina]|uniref:6-bladed beta-propeller n=1 Tax=Paraglaciecola aquimarina TaxID=1235557 RepID=A0ABU3SY09_9ALTE|nr:6-bladed beta-propeller [Paraglaciecola aquimarina]MDU0354893.1 6-bladed beta-propeller [Paraglaciecola aquimarina]
MSAPQSDPHGKIIGSGDFCYRVNMHWGQLDPTKVPVENCHDLAIDSQGRILMITDNVKNNIIIYSQSGELLEAWGTEFPGGHSLKVVNENGQDFLYVVDSGWLVNPKWDGVSTDDWDSPFNKVVAQSGFIAKLTIEGRLIYSIGHPQQIGVYTPDQPFRPTDIAIADNGDLYVTDGYGSDYVLQYDSQGRFIRSWGGHDNQDPNLNLSNTHGIRIDTRHAGEPHLIVSSRAEMALKLFTMQGQYIDTIATPGAYIGAPVIKGDYGFAPVCWSHVNGGTAVDSGFISILDKDNKVIVNLGGTQPEYIDGRLQPMCSTWDIFKHCHTVCIDKDDNLYVGQWRANQSYPIKLEKI